MKFCTKCGAELMDEAVICPKCGCACGTVNNYSMNAPATNSVAIAGLICAFFIPLLGWILGGIGLSKASQMNGNGKGIAIAAIVVATVEFLLVVCIYAVVIAMYS